MASTPHGPIGINEEENTRYAEAESKDYGGPVNDDEEAGGAPVICFDEAFGVAEPESAVSVTLPTLVGKLTLSEALDEEENMLPRLAYPNKRMDFLVPLYQQRRKLEELVAQHLGLDENETARLSDVKEWLHGSFNICFPVYIDDWRRCPNRKVMLRLPLPYKLGELGNPGNADEKHRAEVAAFLWIQENAPNVPIPFLWGFGFQGGRSYMQPKCTAWATRSLWYFQRWLSSFFSANVPCPYVAFDREHILDNGYLIMDFIEAKDARMLSSTWDELHHDSELRCNLFRDLSRIMLNLSQLPLPRIGSWSLDNRGCLVLNNRPLMHQFQHLENEGIPTDIPRTLTYTATDTYYSDLLGCHDNRIRHQPNSMLDEIDGNTQIANLFAMRGLMPQFIRKDLRNGPFVFNLTDLHRSNIFVDNEWHIKCIVDLEWTCSLPVEMISVPYWLTNRGGDQLTGGELEKFDLSRQEFMDIFEEEEKSFPPVYGKCTYRTDLMQHGWKTGSFWYLHALQTTKGMYNLFNDHIQPRFQSEADKNFGQVMSAYWARDAKDLVATKLIDKQRYEQQIRRLFEETMNAQKS